MADNLEIDFALTDFPKVQKAFESLSKLTAGNAESLKKVGAAAGTSADACKKLSEQIDRINRMNAKTPGVSGSSRGGSFLSATASKPPRYVAGPYQRRFDLGLQAAQAASRGDSLNAKDIALAQKTNDRRIAGIEKVGGGGIGGKIMEALQSSRFSIGKGGGQLMPLVSKVTGIAAEALGPEVAALAGPVGIAVAAAVAAGKALFEVAQSAADAGVAFSSFAAQTGGFGRSGALALSIGAQGGMDAGATAGQANALQNTITGSAMGRLMGSTLGVYNLPGMYGSQDYAQQYATAIENARKIKDPTQRLMLMRGAGIEGSFGATMTSDKQFAYSKSDAALQSQIMGPDFLQKSADFEAALGRVSTSWETLMAALGKPMLKLFADELNYLADAMNRATLAMDSPAFGGKGKAATLGNGIIPGVGPGTPSTDPNTDATNRNTKALDKLSDKIPGVYGSDPTGRGEAAIPDGAAYGRNALAISRQEYVKGGMRLGAF